MSVPSPTGEETPIHEHPVLNEQRPSANSHHHRRHHHHNKENVATKPAPQSPEAVTNNKASMQQKLLSPGDLINNRWSIERHLSEGGFGQIFIARDAMDSAGRRVAIKTESGDAKLQMLHTEFTCSTSILKHAVSDVHFMHIHDSGSLKKPIALNFLVMDLGGYNLRELKKATPHDQFSISTSLRVCRQLIQSVYHFHSAGWIHRDVKPSNFCLSPDSKKLLKIIDFGLARRFLDSMGRLLPPRSASGFHGTVRYASMNTHLNKDMGRVDDLWPVCYVLYEHMNGQLPWRTLRDKTEVLDSKRGFDLNPRMHFDSCRYFYQQLQHMTFFSEPPYELFISQLQAEIQRLNINEHDAYDWEVLSTLWQPPAVDFTN